ncbi:MAG: 23S rRNA (adenine(1618)-N(6))-methyltransferase RlmF [Bizionia sp.]|nr:23S rRNA (adenine(1618)-N(6))-methyltransferase RlmF [Bizionia sp.]
MHKRNKHKDGYNFDNLLETNKDLEPFVFTNTHGTQTIDFAKPDAVKALNRALLETHYNISHWQFPKVNLCPPIPGRVEYIHYMADLLKMPKPNANVKVLDIGTGASCIYPLLGHAEYDWQFVATDISEDSLAAAKKIVEKNKLNEAISFRLQRNPAAIFKGILRENDAFSLSICNPPFYKSEAEAFEATTRKLKGLGKLTDTVVRNFAGTAQELWFEGGEKAFLHTYLYESSLYKKQCVWFTSLVSNKAHVKSMQASLKKLNAETVRVITMPMGNKVSRVVAWTFFTDEELKEVIKNNYK